jgi:PPM family protein phosphatase
VSDTSTTSLPALRSAYRSDPGRVRTNNEDLPLVDPDRGVYGVIDGVGGHVAGELAAAIACDVITQRLARPLGTPAERVREAIAIANNEIFKRAETSPDLHGMTCVVTLALVSDSGITVGHVGDSRLYKLDSAGIRKITHDHSPVGEREDAGEIAEADAMRHPRRHEVFRDVGSAQRDKDEEDYVEVIEEPLDRESAILVCTDGLTDMVPSIAIEQVVRQHAGSPDAVVDALVNAANEAGGRDNVTVVYAETPQFARAFRLAPIGHSSAAPQIVTAGSVTDQPAEPQALPSNDGPGALRSVGRWIAGSRTTWFAFGAMIGALATLALLWRGPDRAGTINRTLIVGTDASATFSGIRAAMEAAHPGDVVQLEPGTYTERVVVADGVSLVARLPGTVTFARAPAAVGEWIGITAGGELGGRISGIRLESTLELPMDVGIRVSGGGRAIELAEITGPMHIGVELVAGTSATVQGTHFSVPGEALTVGDGADALVTGNVFVRAGRAAAVAPVSIGNATNTTLKRNLFAGYGTEVVKGLSAAERQQFATGNVIVTAEPSVIR